MKKAKWTNAEARDRKGKKQVKNEEKKESKNEVGGLKKKIEKL